ncbi:MAG: hypothetical protein A2579_09770 [Lysobacterales bacterium RIFOXYD1_FULL_69_11]|nr:MAG: hypothetical protein A2190_10600 [Xanthomonadales bacterium RIFOXYA1_FULL_69_10]OHE85969.1 MAG: hypothetical protein A2579_09770 [Xanthomonadales bacterium RIFOXYD1_FULL_69_11]
MADAGLVAQQAVVAVAVMAACVYVVRRQFPQALRRGRMRLVLVLLRPHRAAWLQRLGRRLAPKVAAGPAAAACGQSGSCGGCSPG